MDDRVREHAEVLVDWSARVEEGDDVIVSVSEGCHDLAVAVSEALGERGANVVTLYSSAEANRAYLRAHDDEFGLGEHELALVESADVGIRIGGGRNTSAMVDVDAATRAASSKASEAVREAWMDLDYVSTLHPTRSLAQQAEMSYEAYQEFVYDAILRDWQALADEMAQLKEILDAGSEVRLVIGDHTDVSMSIEGRTAVNSAASVAYNSSNLPSGEVFTAPYDTEGEVCFDVPMTFRGKTVRDVRLAFEDGEVVEYSAGHNEDVLGEILDTDDGARRLGELGIGMNPGIDRFTDNILFDEKMRDTVHLAVGRAYDANLPEGEDGNHSAVHVDMIADVSEDSRLEVDGEVVQRDGVFRWEDKFTA
ncbi:aminopeptidase [Halorubellus sp. JP-L1]|uniref:aminopeptidase n=1 Tax=Halorubellus sp. JP-L1 TaxID=2715753 RepID=UPI00140C8239|nr:aminopeptidase [Halorubellus sp. JP-L1]NHN41636.1 aminopeptidase [Halorubellus sp. JP-L1]